MIFRHAYHNGVWIDLEHPTEEEVHAIAQEFSISERLEAEILTPSPSPLVANDTGVAFLVLHFPTHGEADGDIRDQEIDFIVGDSFIITIRYEVVASLHRLHKMLETQKLLSPHDAINADVLLETIFAHLYTSVRDHTAHIASRLSHIERDMFNGHERETIRATSNTIREFLHVQASLANQEESLHLFLKSPALQAFMSDTFHERASRIITEHAQVNRLVQTYRAVATELRETNAALLETRQNEIMKTLTLITVIVLPLELLAFIFGMHLPGTPLDQNPHAFWIILAAMLAISGSLLVFFARKRWL